LANTVVSDEIYLFTGEFPMEWDNEGGGRGGCKETKDGKSKSFAKMS
jgi:hypothetical protein